MRIKISKKSLAIRIFQQYRLFMFYKIPIDTSTLSDANRELFANARLVVEELKMNAIAASQATNSNEPFLDLGAVIEDAYLRGLTNACLLRSTDLKAMH